MRMIDRALEYYSNPACRPLSCWEFHDTFPRDDMTDLEEERLLRALVVCRDGMIRNR